MVSAHRTTSRSQLSIAPRAQSVVLMALSSKAALTTATNCNAFPGGERSPQGFESDPVTKGSDTRTEYQHIEKQVSSPNNGAGDINLLPVSDVDGQPEDGEFLQRDLRFLELPPSRAPSTSPPTELVELQLNPHTGHWIHHVQS